MGKVLFVADDPLVLRAIGPVLRENRGRVTLVCGGRDAYLSLGREPYDVLILDAHLHDVDGVALLQTVKSNYPDLVRVVFGGELSDDPAAGEELARLCHRALEKPSTPDEVRRIIEEALQLTPGGGDVKVSKTGTFYISPAWSRRWESSGHG